MYLWVEPILISFFKGKERKEKKIHVNLIDICVLYLGCMLYGQWCI